MEPGSGEDLIGDLGGRAVLGVDVVGEGGLPQGFEAAFDLVALPAERPPLVGAFAAFA
ncbi:hypothetical protein ACIQGZ_04205 [Streptomyces sp. NPDC092296]|uniref:hypothetical protein n=1 Tax=Streptomyces sp. NPDC092296 TaxID=3366012 RepID=UPI00380E1F7B